MTLFLPGILFLTLFLPGSAVGFAALLAATILVGAPMTLAVIVLLVPIATAYLTGAFFDRYAFGSLTLSRVAGFELFAPIASVLSAYLLISSDRYLGLVFSISSNEFRVQQFLPLLNQILMIATFVSLVLLFSCLCCELPIRWMQKGSFQKTSLRLASVRPLLLCFLLSCTLHLVFDFVEDELFHAVKRNVMESQSSRKVPSHG